jgi:hypothetical protein
VTEEEVKKARDRRVEVRELKFASWKLRAGLALTSPRLIMSTSKRPFDLVLDDSDDEEVSSGAVGEQEDALFHRQLAQALIESKKTSSGSASSSSAVSSTTSECSLGLCSPEEIRADPCVELQLQLLLRS